MKVEKKINCSLFKHIIIDIKCDDLVLDKSSNDDCVITLDCNHNMGSDMNLHLKDSSLYEIYTNIIDEVLYINYFQSNYVPLTSYDFIEDIKITILIPNSITYEIK